jgi:hypothetical protein
MLYEPILLKRKYDCTNLSVRVDTATDKAQFGSEPGRGRTRRFGRGRCPGRPGPGLLMRQDRNRSDGTWELAAGLCDQPL